MLAIAAKDGRCKLAKVLLHMKASIDSKDRNGDTPLSLAAYYGKDRVVELLLQRMASTENRSRALVIAAGSGKAGLKNARSIRIVELLLAYDADPDPVDQFGNQDSALLKAAENGNVDIFKRLLESNAGCPVEKVRGQFRNSRFLGVPGADSSRGRESGRRLSRAAS